jgi:S-adenosylmethionine:tRNA ribosyltransferase-isomerase
MNAAAAPRPSARRARLLAIDENGHVSHHRAADLPSLLQRGDLVVANDAATLPASLQGTHLRTGRPVEVRLAGRRSLAAHDVTRFIAVIFGAGDHRTPTEHRPDPPRLQPDDELALGHPSDADGANLWGEPCRLASRTRRVRATETKFAPSPLRATVVRTLGHRRLIELEFNHPPAVVWEGIARHGRPIQYAYVPAPLAVWDTWTSIASLPVAFEPPSAGFILDWATLRSLRSRGVRFAAITHAAGISSTGDAELDRLLPFDEPYYVPRPTAALIRHTMRRGGRIVAVGTTVVRALEDAARLPGWVLPGHGVATQRITPLSNLRVVDAIVSGMHEAGSSHYELLRAFQDDPTLQEMTTQAEARGYLAHEFGDLVFIARGRNAFSRRLTA